MEEMMMMMMKKEVVVVMVGAFVVVAYCAHGGINIDKLEQYLYYWRPAGVEGEA